MPKKPKLSPEEKKKLKEAKKLAKELAILEAKRQVKRDELTRELKYGKQARKKIRAKWHKVMMDIKIPQLKIELQVAINNADLIMDTKDFIISFLMDELEEAEAQYAFNLRAHCATIENIYKIYLRRLNDLKQEYDNELLCLHNALNQQLDEIQLRDGEAEMHLKTMIYQLTVEEKHLENMGRSMYMSKQNETEAKNKEESNLKRKKSEDQFESIWRTYTKYLDNYLSQIKDTEKDFNERMERDDAVVKIIKKQSEDIGHQYNTSSADVFCYGFNKIIARKNLFTTRDGSQEKEVHDSSLLRIAREHQTNEKETLSKKIVDLTNEKDYLHNIFINLRRTYINDVAYDEKILTNLVVESNAIINSMQSNVTLAEKILTLYSNVRKYETKREKILAFPKIIPRKFKIENEWGNLKSLVNFWQKCALADKARNNVNDEYLHLLEENCVLKNTVKACLNYDCNKRPPSSITPIHKKILRGSINPVIIHKV